MQAMCVLTHDLAMNDMAVYDGPADSAALILRLVMMAVVGAMNSACLGGKMLHLFGAGKRGAV